MVDIEENAMNACYITHVDNVVPSTLTK